MSILEPPRAARVFFYIAISFGIVGCARVEVDRVTAYNQPGIRYWRPAPYIALQPVTANGATTCDAKVVMLPDKKEEFAITMQAGYGSAEASPNLQDGWNLTSMTGKADSKTAETLTALASVIKSIPIAGVASTSGKPGSKTVVSKCAGLYKLIYDETGELVSFRPMPLSVQTVVIPTPQSPKPVDPKKCGQPGQPPCTE
jgi:hypothetical protein